MKKKKNDVKCCNSYESLSEDYEEEEEEHECDVLQEMRREID